MMNNRRNTQRLEWYRKSEFTGDRAGLLVIQNPQVLLSMMKFAGGTLFQRNQMDAGEFLRQADLYEEVDANVLDRVYKMLLVTPVTHPLTIVRAREIMTWSESREYKDILAGRYARRRSPQGSNGNASKTNTGGSAPETAASSTTGLITCPRCGREQRNRRFCSLCGGAIS
jgi:hypothetical protein